MMKKNFFINTVITLSIMLLSACGSLSQLDVNHVEIAKGVNLKLTALKNLPPHQSKQQLLTITHHGETHQLITQLEFTAHGLTLVAISPQGLPLFEVVFIEGEPLQQKHYIAFEMLPLAFIIADIQMVYWPVDQLNASLTGAKIITSLDQSNRKLALNGETIINIIKNGNDISYHHLQRNYQLTITDSEQ